MDPHLVLGGFPTAADAFRNFTADATAFVVTLPIDSHPANRCVGGVGGLRDGMGRRWGWCQEACTPTTITTTPRREAALAWEAAFVGLAAGRLSAMAQGAGLRLSFSAERSVQDELARESTAGK